AGLRSNPDEVERIGIERAQQEFIRADHILLVVDASRADELKLEKLWPEGIGEMPDRRKITLVVNKIDLNLEQPRIGQADPQAIVYISAKTGAGLSLLKEHLKNLAGFSGAGEGSFTARRRHVNALE